MQRPNNRYRLLLLLVVAFLPAIVKPGEAAEFRFLGDLGAGLGFETAHAISADGSTVVGQTAALQPIRWSVVGGGEVLGTSFGQAYGVSDDGSAVVGSTHGPLGGHNNEANRWDATNGIQLLGYLPGGGTHSHSYGVSANGEVVVGMSPSSTHVAGSAFRWNASGGMIALDSLPSPAPFSQAFAVSADGNIIVGETTSTIGLQPALWNVSAGTVTGLGDLPGGSVQGSGRAVSSDGGTVVGFTTGASGREAFRWTAATGMAGLGSLPGGFSTSEAYAVSGDGQVVVGQIANQAFVWDSNRGMRSLQVVLAASGIDFGNWNLSEATGISADGRTIVGTALDPQGLSQGWIAVVPEPSVSLLVALGLAVLASPRRGSA